MDGWTRSWFGVAALVICLAAIVRTQSRNDDAGGSLAGVTLELRQLRLAVEELSRNQAQTQAIGVYLSVQQRRITQATARLDAVRKELDAASMRSREIAANLAAIEEQLIRVSEPARRSQLEEGHRQLKFEQARVDAQEQSARSRDSELSQSLQLDESRWADLVSRLEQFIKP